MNENALKPNTTLRGKAYTYTIQKVLGQGTFGITYLATTQVKVTGALGELETTMQVAIKEFFMKEMNGREENSVTSGNKGGVYDKYKQKFAREAENLSKLHHPNIVRVLEYFEANNTVYYAMEYMEGGSLDKYIEQKGGLPEAKCVKYAKQIGAALSYMHAHKMLHLDLKPGNVMLRKNGDAVLIDFGLSKQYDESGNPETSTTVGGGTPGYAPIEQANYHEGKGFPVTMDVYALGATMFKMLTGERAPEAADILNEGFPAYELQKHQVSNALIACVARAMAALKKDRPQSVEAFLKSLDNREEGDVWPEEETDLTESEEDVAVPIQPTVDPTPTQNASKYKKFITLGLTAILIIAGTVVYTILKSDSKVTENSSPTEQTYSSTTQKTEQEVDSSSSATNTTPTFTELGVDLGLSVNWAGWNVGASAPDEYGGLYGWADPSGKKISGNNDEYPSANPPLNICGTNYDIANVQWGHGWRLPTKAEMEELINKCKWEWGTYNNTKGYKVTGANGNSIFLPAGGYRSGWLGGEILEKGIEYEKSREGYYMTGSSYEETHSIPHLYFHSGRRGLATNPRSNGYSVRPVAPKK